jgi:hypothetical protein
VSSRMTFQCPLCSQHTQGMYMVCHWANDHRIDFYSGWDCPSGYEIEFWGSTSPAQDDRNCEHILNCDYCQGRFALAALAILGGEG